MKIKMFCTKIFRKRHNIIVGGYVLTKDFPEYSVVSGNPSKLIKFHKE